MKDCCTNSENLTVVAVNDKTFKVCRVCNANHYGMKAEPGRLGAMLGKRTR